LIFLLAITREVNFDQPDFEFPSDTEGGPRQFVCCDQAECKDMSSRWADEVQRHVRA